MPKTILKKERDREPPKIRPPSARGKSGSDIVPISENLPLNLILLPVSQGFLFPGMIVPFIVPEGILTKSVERAMEKSEPMGVVLSNQLNDVATKSNIDELGTGETDKEPVPPVVAPKDTKPSDTPFYQYGVAAKVLRKINLPDNQISVLLLGLQRFHLKKVVSDDPHWIGSVEYYYEQLKKDTELEALVRMSLQQFKAISKDNPLISEEVKVTLVNIDGPGKLVDFMSSILVREPEDYQNLIAAKQVHDRFHLLLLLLQKETEVQSVQRKISDEIHDKISASQREFYLQEQLRLIKKELGRTTEGRGGIVERFKKRLETKTVPELAMERILEEFEKLENISEHSSEYSVAINYLDWVTALPWGQRTEDSEDLKRAQRILDNDHYGLKDVKDRILEFLAVKKLKATSQGSILCFVGPPGTGKTSLGKSIAHSLRRSFFRFSVGGMRDESEIKGHRRTYVGAMPGKIIQGMKRVATENPVFLIDEVDKLGSHAIAGDPSSALLEVLDPEQNHEFVDYYVDIPFDCSKVFFIATANTTDTIPHALLDRMEVIELHGYMDHEKVKIARKHLIPKALLKSGLTAKQITIADEALLKLIEDYARESGVRNLEKQILRLFRKAALKIAKKTARSVSIGSRQDLEKYLGLPVYTEFQPKVLAPGVARGLAWTSYGGEVLYVEGVKVVGKGGLVLTGQMGEVMQESANIAHTLVRGLADRLKLDKEYFEQNTFHLHVPAGATPKDGPSAGVTMVISLYSLIVGKSMKPGIAMTGEISLTGHVLAVGGIQEKILAAKRQGIKTIILPKDNQKDLKELDAALKKGMHFILVSSVNECLKHALGDAVVSATKSRSKK